jgi:hypothetical protein
LNKQQKRSRDLRLIYSPNNYHPSSRRSRQHTRKILKLETPNLEVVIGVSPDPWIKKQKTIITNCVSTLISVYNLAKAFTSPSPVNGTVFNLYHGQLKKFKCTGKANRCKMYQGGKVL